MAYETGKNEIAAFMRRLYRQKLTTTLGGNISLRLPDGNLLVTPSATDKGEIRPDDIGVVSPDGETIGKPFKPSIETGMHLEIYRKRPDVNAVVHAHPVTVCAFSASETEIDTNLILEAKVVLGELAYADFAPMGTSELAAKVAESAANADCVVMRNHGALTVGASLLEAFDRLEVLENAAQMTILALGPLKDSVIHTPPA